MLVKANQEVGAPNQIHVLDHNSNCPAALAGGIHVPGNSATGEGYRDLAARSDIITLDLENVAVDKLAELQSEHLKVIPDLTLLQRITDKLEQKKWLQELGLPTAAFQPHDGENPVEESQFGFPVVHKAARGGYDGRGVFVLRSAADNDSRLRVRGYLEQYIERKMEVSVMVAANTAGEVRAYQAVEMVFHEGGNVLDYLVAPARLPDRQLQAAQDLAIRAISAIGGTGIFGIEMFLTRDDELLINEISPRTHNSGHYTTEACVSSQFDQQLRILSGQALGDVLQLVPAVMFNILGAAGFEGDTVVDIDPLLEGDDQIAIHIYGKTHCFAGRKMGHVTVTADTVEDALAKMLDSRERITIRGAKQLV